MMIDRVPTPALSHLRPALRLARPARPVIGLKGRRATRATARGRRAAPDPSPAPAGLGRPGSPLRAHPAPAPEAADAPAGHPRHRPALAPPPRRPQVDLPEPERTAAGHVPLENRIQLVTCGSSACQAACVYSLIRPPRTGFRRMCRVSTSVTVARGASSSSWTRWAMPWCSAVRKTWAAQCCRQQAWRGDGWLAGCCSRASTCWSAGYSAWLS